MSRFVAILAAVAAFALLGAGCGGGGGGTATAPPPPATQPAAPQPLQVANGPIEAADPGRPPLRLKLAATEDLVRLRFHQQPRSGLLFDLDTGEVLWRRLPNRVLPIASLTKMMTALVVIDRLPAGAKVPVTKQALRYRGSGVGLLPRGKWIAVDTMLHGLLLPSGNDAAIALAQHVSGTVGRFVTDMNVEARSLGLGCTHFSSPDGLKDRGNRSCVRDLAVLAREVLRRPRLARIVRTSVIALPGLVPHTVKRGKRKRTVWRPGGLWLVNNNPLLRAGYRGTTGVKTGYTDAAGRCLVVTVRRGRTVLGAILLHSPDPGYQAMRLFNRGFRALRLRRARSTVGSAAR